MASLHVTDTVTKFVTRCILFTHWSDPAMAQKQSANILIYHTLG